MAAPVPLGTPYTARTSDIYNGLYIPKGATVFANIWAMSRDEAEQFPPERFLDSEGMLTDDIPDLVFGFGRRLCPGRHTADVSLWMAMVTMLATLDFGHASAKDADGKDIAFEVKYMNGMAPSRISKASLEQALTK